MHDTLLTSAEVAELTSASTSKRIVYRPFARSCLA